MFAGILLSIFTALTIRSDGLHIVVPNEMAESEGDVNNVFPIFEPGTRVYYRYQQIYLSSHFTNAGPRFAIIGIAFRVEGGGGMPWGPSNAFNDYLGRILVKLSTTVRSIDGLSATYQENIGPDETTTFDGGLWFRSSIGWSTGPTPRPFEQTIPFRTPFIYEPARGNLLVEIWNFAPIGVPNGEMLDACWNNSAVSRVWGVHAESTESVNGTPNSIGLVTRFLLAPSLSVSSNDSTNCTISWPVTDEVFVLEAASSLSSSSSWQGVTNSLSIVNGRNTLRFSFDSTSRFFRLRRTQ